MTDAKPARVSRPVVVSFRLSEAEAAHVDAAAQAMTPRRTRSDWARAATLHAARVKVPSPPPPRRNPPRRTPPADVRALATALAALGRIGGEIGSLAATWRSAGRPTEEAELCQIATDVATVAAGLRRALEGGEAHDH